MSESDEIRDAADVAGLNLDAGFDNAMKAEEALAKELRENTITAFSKTQGIVAELGESIRKLLSFLRREPPPNEESGE